MRYRGESLNIWMLHVLYIQQISAFIPIWFLHWAANFDLLMLGTPWLWQHHRFCLSGCDNYCRDPMKLFLFCFGLFCFNYKTVILCKFMRFIYLHSSVLFHLDVRFIYHMSQCCFPGTIHHSTKHHQVAMQQILTSILPISFKVIM